MSKRKILAALLLAGSVGAAESSGAGELSLFGTNTTGDYGTGHQSDVRIGWLRYSTGDRFQFRIAVSYLDVQGSELIYLPGLGPVHGGRDDFPGGPGGHQTGGDSSGNGDGNGDGHQNGDGNQNGNSNQNGDGNGNQQQSSGDSLEGLEEGTTQETTYAASGAGDVWVSGFYRLAGGGARVYSVDAGLEIKVPTAEEGELGTGEWDYRPVVSGEYRFWTGTAFGSLGWNLLGDPAWAELENPLDFILGGETDPLWDHLLVSGWVEGNQEFVPGGGSRSAIGMGLRSLGQVRWQLTVTAGLGGSSEDYSVSMGISTGLESRRVGVRRAGY